MTEILTVAGLDDERLDWVRRLYGQADPKYRERPYLEHLFRRNPVGPSLHAFAVDGDRPVGHCCVVRTPALLGASALAAGKLEALWIEESHRGRSAGGETVVRRLLDTLYDFSDANDVELVHALATPRIGKVIAFEPLHPVGERSLVGAVAGTSVPTRALALVQRAAREAAAVPLRGVSLRAAAGSDEDLVAVDRVDEGRWAIVARGAWDWYRESPHVRVLVVGTSRALVQLPASPHEPLRLAGWRARAPGTRSALRLLAAAGRVARAHGAATLRFQPWAPHDDALARACRLAGMIPRDDLTTVWVHTRDPALADARAAVSTPFLYLGF